MDSILYEVVVSTKREVDGGEDGEDTGKEPELCRGKMEDNNMTFLSFSQQKWWVRIKM